MIYHVIPKVKSSLPSYSGYSIWDMAKNMVKAQIPRSRSEVESAEKARFDERCPAWHSGGSKQAVLEESTPRAKRLSERQIREAPPC